MTKKVVSLCLFLFLCTFISCGAANQKVLKREFSNLANSKLTLKKEDVPKWKMNIPVGWQSILPITFNNLPKTENVLTIRSLKSYGDLKIVISLDVGKSNLNNDELFLESGALLSDAESVKGKKIKFKGNEASMIVASSSSIVIFQMIIKKNGSNDVYMYRCVGAPTSEYIDFCMNTVNTLDIN